MNGILAWPAVFLPLKFKIIFVFKMNQCTSGEAILPF